MIPLGHWLLRTPETLDGEDIAPSCLRPHEEDFSESADHVPADTLEKLRELEDALAAANQLNEAERARAAAREDEIVHQLGTVMADRISTELTLGLAELQESIETAIRDVLVPFLNLAASRKAAAELVVLIHEEIAHASEAILEVRVPEHLHGFLEPVFRSSDAPIVLGSASSVEVVCSSRRARFEILAERWIDAVRGSQDG